MLSLPSWLKAFVHQGQKVPPALPAFPIAANTPPLQACTTGRFPSVSLPALPLIFLMSTCGGPRRGANTWVATSLVSVSPRDLCFHSRLHLAYSNQIKMSAGLSHLLQLFMPIVSVW